MMQIQTPAKINTQLHILKKRNDGFHELYTHLIPVSLLDTITLTTNRNQGICFKVAGGPKELQHDNLIVQAATMFAQHTGIEIHLDFHLLKQIPVGAGLGGGSGNAAGVLQALNHWYQLPLKESDLEKMAMKLGADVPFFLHPCPSEAQGKGEQLQPLSGFPVFPLVIVKPHFSISTAKAYQQCRPSHFSVPPPSIHTLEQLTASLHNQFEATLIPKFPILSQIKQKLLKVGAVGALVSGSGSSVFGIFSDLQTQQRAYSKLLVSNLGEIFCCHSLKSHRYFSG